MTSLKEALDNQFGSEESLGIYYADALSGLPKSEHEEYNSLPYDEIAYLPNGEQMGICTNNAHYVAQMLSKDHTVRVFGFLSEDNPVENQEIMDVGGHDFAIVNDRYIVDIWLSVYAGESNQAIFDLKDPKDRKLAQQYYGNPEKWSLFQRELNGASGFLKPDHPQYPKAITSRVARTFTENESNMSI